MILLLGCSKQMPVSHLNCLRYTCHGGKDIESFDTDERLSFNEDACVPAQHVVVWLHDHFVETKTDLNLSLGLHHTHITPQMVIVYTVKEIGSYICDSLDNQEPHMHKELKFIECLAVDVL